MFLTTKRLTIRTYLLKDIDDVFEIYCNSDTCKYLLFEPWLEEEKEEKFKKQLLNQELTKSTPQYLACVLNNKVIGDICFWYSGMKDTLEIGYAFNQNYTNNGYAYEAVKAIIEYLFTMLNIHRIQAVLDARNLKSANLCKRLGMRQEAYFIEDYWNKGEWTSTFVYAMLKSDFDK